MKGMRSVKVLLQQSQRSQRGITPDIFGALNVLQKKGEMLSRAVLFRLGLLYYFTVTRPNELYVRERLYFKQT